MYRPMTAIEVTAKNATVLFRAGSAITIELATHSQIEFVGVPVRGLTVAHSREYGSAPSRLNAYVIRELAVTDAMPQKNWAMATTSSSSLPSVAPAESTKIWATGSWVSLARSAA